MPLPSFISSSSCRLVTLHCIIPLAEKACTQSTPLFKPFLIWLPGLQLNALLLFRSSVLPRPSSSTIFQTQWRTSPSPQSILPSDWRMPSSFALQKFLVQQKACPLLSHLSLLPPLAPFWTILDWMRVGCSPLRWGYWLRALCTCASCLHFRRHFGLPDIVPFSKFALMKPFILHIFCSDPPMQLLCIQTAKTRQNVPVLNRKCTCVNKVSTLV